MRKLTQKEIAAKQKAEQDAKNAEAIQQSQKAILKKLDSKPKPSINAKTQAVAKAAYDKADAALKVAYNQNSLVEQLTAAVKTFKNDRTINGYHMKINRNAEGFMDSIDVELK